ncbi:uncharacterized protein LOC142224065 [Haematobia irritans]|uniref:uncharacterized protein LOC142224065 n=1 Tax=Haematobia irritans TaxID=7368 RepID=UPI003F50CEB2
MLSKKYSFLLLTIIGMIVTSQGRLLKFNDVTIKIGKGHFRCDKLACPRSTDRCVVIKENQANDLSHLMRSNICYSKSNKILKESLTYETVKGDREIRQMYEVHRNGQTNIIASNDFDEMKFKKEFSKFEKGLTKNMEKLHKNIEKIEHKLEHMFA